MFEVKCPSCQAAYKVDERRIPPTGLTMRCPKCGSSFPVAAAGTSAPSDPPVLGGALGLAPPRTHKATMLGVAQEPTPAPPAAKAPAPPRGVKQTMLGVAPAQLGARSGLDLLNLDDEELVDEGSELEADLPMPSPSPSAADLPARSSRRAGEIELPSDDLSIGDEADLPAAPSVGLPALGEVGLPDLPDDLPVAGGAGLPARQQAGLPALRDADFPDLLDVGLPTVGGDGLPGLLETELPVIGGSLPSPAADHVRGLPSLAAKLPNLSGPTELPPASLDEFDLEPEEQLGAGGLIDAGDLFGAAPPRGAGQGGSSRATAGADVFGSGPTTTPESGPGSGGGSAFGEVPLGEEDGDEFDAFPTESSGGKRTATGPGYGDVALDEGASGGAVGLGADVERDEMPRGPAPAASARVELPGAETTDIAVVAPRRAMSKGAKIAIFTGVGVAVVGGALASLLPDVGPYGAYLVIDTIQQSGHEQALVADEGAARSALVLDSAQAVERAFAALDAGRAGAPRFHTRTAYAGAYGSLSGLRFGSSLRAATSGKALVDSLAERAEEDVPELALSRAAALAASGSYKEALQRAKGRIGRSLEWSLLAAESALMLGDFALAERAFTAIRDKNPGPLGGGGLARVRLAQGKYDDARREAEAVLSKQPKHVASLLVLSAVELQGRKVDQPIMDRLAPIIAGKVGASQREVAAAQVLVGDLHLSRARIADAEKAFTAALKLAPGDAAAQRGLADALFEAGRFSEAQTRYGAALQSAPDSLEAGIGVVRCKLQLEDIEEASAAVERLMKAHPDSTVVNYWLGRAKDRAGNREAALKAYEKAISLNQPGSDLVQAYVSLSRLLGQQGRAEEAGVVMSQAEERFPDDPLVYEAMAEMSSERGSFDDAIADYDKALELDPGNLGLRFQRGIVLRKARRFDEAEKEFEAVAQVSKDYPGLALELGNLYDASGKSEAALAAYQSALDAAPNDLDLQLRVACGKANARQSKAALDQIQKVYAERPNSAEVNFCMGVAYLFKPSLADARRHLLRAVGFDASRAVYHLYAGWMALELSDYQLARRELDKAIELDQTLADAYFKRGELNVRQAAVDDAVVDLNRALALNPTLGEAHAQLALAQMQRGDEPAALSEWKLATDMPTAGAYEHYQYGKLLLDNQRKEEAVQQLAVAVEKVVKLDPPPPYRWEIHRQYAMSLGRRIEAKDHWEQFLLNAPSDSPYRREAMRELKAILDQTGH